MKRENRIGRFNVNGLFTTYVIESQKSVITVFIETGTADIVTDH